MNTASDDPVLAATDRGVRTLTLNRPERRNSWNRALEERYFDRLDEADADDEVRAVVVTGSGNSFCPGADITDLHKVAAAGRIDVTNRRSQHYPLRVRKPIVAAINGACAGLGLVQALFCDVRFAARGARFTTAYARRALPAEYGISFLLPRLIGVEKALDLLLSGRVFDADEAHAIGLVSRLCPPETVLADAQNYAADLAAHCSPRAMAAIRRQVYGDLSRDYESALLDAVVLMQDSATHPDLAEGARSFADRRPPEFLPLEKDFRPREGEFPF